MEVSKYFKTPEIVGLIEERQSIKNKAHKENTKSLNVK